MASPQSKFVYPTEGSIVNAGDVEEAAHRLPDSAAISSVVIKVGTPETDNRGSVIIYYTVNPIGAVSAGDKMMEVCEECMENLLNGSVPVGPAHDGALSAAAADVLNGL